MRRSSSERTNPRWPTLALFLVCAATLSLAQKNPVKPKPIPVSTHKFALQKEGDSFFLQPLPSTPQQPRIAIPREWLIPKEDEATDDPADSSPVDPFNYDRHVTSFPIGNGEIGLRFSSFDAMTDGSMQLAQGKDVFLIYSPTSGKLRPGGFDLGITKERIWGRGCFHAHMVHLLVGDSNEDGLTDIGVVKEEIWCPEVGDEPEDEEDPSTAKAPEKKLPPELENITATHLYQQHNPIWYVYTPQGWKLDLTQAGTPENHSELPLTGIVLSPVDYVASRIWRSYDPKSWIDPPRYMPAYRKNLIAGPPPGPWRPMHPPKLETAPRK